MKVKISVDLSQELMQVMDEFHDLDKNRSHFLEKVAWDYIARLRRIRYKASDIEIIN